MKLLSFQARRFRWEPFSRTLEDAPDPGQAKEVRDAVVVFYHAEGRDFAGEEAGRRVFRHLLKHIKWLANKRGLRRVVLHSFTHLGGDTADAADAGRLAGELAARLEETGYETFRTPFGWFCSWELEVFGESLAKVWKEI